MLGQIDAVDAVRGPLQSVLLRTGVEERSRLSDDISVGNVNDYVVLGNPHDVLRPVVCVHDERGTTPPAGPMVLLKLAKDPSNG
jgi:hypothetical protein